MKSLLIHLEQNEYDKLLEEKTKSGLTWKELILKRVK